MFIMWRLRWTILRALDDLVATGVLKKYKHLDGTYIFKKSSHWRSLALETMMSEYNKERDKKIAQESSLRLHETYFLQYNSLLFNCERQFLKLFNLELYAIIENLGGQGYCQFVIVILVRAGMNKEEKSLSGHAS